MHRTASKQSLSPFRSASKRSVSPYKKGSREQDSKSAGEIWKQKGNSAFSDSRYNEAIDAYSRAIKYCPENDNYYACRSLAYLKAGRYEDALVDADYCITLKRDHPQGYLRKGSVYRAMREYGKAIAVYSEGLLACPREERLSKGLAAAKRSKAKHGKGRASQAIQKSEMVRRVSRESILKRNDVKKAGTVSTYVKEAREELSVKLEAIQSQMNLLDELETMDDEEKMELLFNVVDIDGEGITARELAMALRKHNKELSFQDSIEHAICLIAAFDTTGDARLDLDQFKACIGVMLKDLDVSLADFAEFLVIRMVLSHDADVPLSDDCTAAEIGLLSNKNVEKDFSGMLSV